jgi:hypothetical protein
MQELFPELSIEFKTECLNAVKSFKKQIHEKYPFANPECNMRDLTHAIDYRLEFGNELTNIKGVQIQVWKYLLITYFIFINDTLLNIYDGEIPDVVIIRKMVEAGFDYSI